MWERSTNPTGVSNCLKKYCGDYIGMRFGKLVVESYPIDKKGIRRAGAFCRCDCGREEYVGSMSRLFSGSKYQCVHCGREQQAESIKRHWSDGTINAQPSRYGDLRQERLYGVWLGMRQRAKETVGCYADVSICDEWQDYLVFREWAYGHGYDDKAPKGQCTIDRINPFGNYEPLNCRFADKKTQARNKRKRWAQLDDETREALIKTSLQSA